MFEIQAPMPDTGEILTAYICGANVTKMRDWMLSRMEGETDVLSFNAVPTKVTRAPVPHEFWPAMWWKTSVAITRDRQLGIQEFNMNKANLTRVHVVTAVFVQLADLAPYTMIGFHPDGLPKLIPSNAPQTRNHYDGVRVFPGELIQLNTVPLSIANDIEVTNFPYALANEDVLAYQTSYRERQEEATSAISINFEKQISPTRTVMRSRNIPGVGASFTPKNNVLEAKMEADTRKDARRRAPVVYEHLTRPINNKGRFRDEGPVQAGSSGPPAAKRSTLPTPAKIVFPVFPDPVPAVKRHRDEQDQKTPRSTRPRSASTGTYNDPIDLDLTIPTSEDSSANNSNRSGGSGSTNNVFMPETPSNSTRTNSSEPYWDKVTIPIAEVQNTPEEAEPASQEDKKPPKKYKKVTINEAVDKEYMDQDGYMMTKQTLVPTTVEVTDSESEKFESDYEDEAGPSLSRAASPPPLQSDAIDQSIMLDDQAIMAAARPDPIDCEYRRQFRAELNEFGNELKEIGTGIDSINDDLRRIARKHFPYYHPELVANESTPSPEDVATGDVPSDNATEAAKDADSDYEFDEDENPDHTPCGPPGSCEACDESRQSSDEEPSNAAGAPVKTEPVTPEIPVIPRKEDEEARGM